MLRKNMNQEAYIQMVANLITEENDFKKNYWSELASVICCERSDVYLKSLTTKVRDFFFDANAAAESKKKRRKEKRLQSLQNKKEAEGPTAKNDN